MTGTPPAPGPAEERDDPAATLARVRKELREYTKQQRLQRLAQGKGKPRTRKETEIWSEGVRRRFGIADDAGDGGSGADHGE